jgi:hypothetical protein
MAKTQPKKRKVVRKAAPRKSTGAPAPRQALSQPTGPALATKATQHAKRTRTRDSGEKKANTFKGLDSLDEPETTLDVLTMRHSGAPLATVNGDSPV